MTGFYDKILPDFLNKYGKQWGAKVEETTIETPKCARLQAPVDAFHDSALIVFTPSTSLPP